MIPSDPAATLQLYLKTQPSPLQVVNDASPDVKTLFTVGEQIQAAVKGELPSGRYAVEVKNQLLDLNLPRNTQPGEQLQLKVLGTEPRLTFQLLSQSAPQASNAPLPNGKEVQISQNALLIETLSNIPKNAPGELKSASVSKPLVENPMKESPTLAHKLHESISKGGPFYEAHQAEWVTGQRSLGELKNEPKALMALAPGESAPIPVESQPIVKQQLEILDQRAVVWHGMAWPGQPMSMLIQQNPNEVDERENTASSGESQAGWKTELQLALPALGELNASIQLVGGKIDLRISADNDDALSRLKDHIHSLHTRFETAGLSLNSIAMQLQRHDI